MMRRLRCMLLLCLAWPVSAASAQPAAARDSIRTMIADAPMFGMFRSNYFVTGIPLDRPVGSRTADAAFRISIYLKCWQMSASTTLLFTYSQKSFWNIYEQSAPFRDTNFNPGLWVVWPVVRGDGLRGVLLGGVEHESNGRDGTASRAWNYATVSYTCFAVPRWQFAARIWYGIYDREGNPNWFRYRGYGQLSAVYTSRNGRWEAALVVNPTGRFTSFNLTGECYWRLSRKPGSLPCLFVQAYSGYAESMIDYDRYTAMLRVGIAIKPFGLNFY